MVIRAFDLLASYMLFIFNLALSSTVLIYQVTYNSGFLDRLILANFFVSTVRDVT